MDEATTLETERLLLRRFRPDDFDAFAAMMADPEVADNLGGVRTREDAWRELAMHAGHWLLRGYGQWAVVDKADGCFAGRLGLWNPEGWPGIEVGWTIARAYQGRGYATEGGAAALAWAWANLDVDAVISVIQPANTASIAVATKLGLRYDRTEVVRGLEHGIYRIVRP